jgi:hypothetical protein
MSVLVNPAFAPRLFVEMVWWSQVRIVMMEGQTMVMDVLPFAR